ncbi:hypothetical protein EII38_09850 [Streptococcus minor]|uniref:YopX protein domain-containing protein n=1 Tax=Streptococcus minor TaxID=229549 RepID=A0A3P1V6A0_9STRE|nr:YopX family protein [Streptococcus minor]RRD29217.1 hypothetical protein EII38_09850 [Streptococcus minor]
MIPKYRAWDVHNKKMFTESELVIWHGNVYANDYQKLFKKFIEGARGLVGYSIDDKYLMQSTWIKDKNGKEIFEGDVVVVLDGMYTVFYDEKTASFRLKPHDKRWHTDYMSNYAHSDSFEVIGNIYENPELIEEANNVDD